MNNHGYVYIEKWGRYMGSGTHYIQAKCDRAQRENAPLDAIHADHDHPGRWLTTDDIANNSARTQLGLEPLPPEAPVCLRVYNGEPAGIDLLSGYMQFRFTSLAEAAQWIAAWGLAGRAQYTGRMQLFSEPAVIRLLPAS